MKREEYGVPRGESFSRGRPCSKIGMI